MLSAEPPMPRLVLATTIRGEMTADAERQSRLGHAAAWVASALERVPKWVKRVVQLLAAIAIVVLVVQHGRPVLAGLDRIAHVRGWILLAAVLAEAASCLAFALASRQLLRRDGLAVRLKTLLRLTLAGAAMSSSLPAGDAASSAYWVRELGRKGVDHGRAGVLLARSLILNVLTLGMLLVVGAIVVGRSGPLGGERTLVIAAGGGVIVAAALLGPPLVRFLRRRFPSVLAPVEGHLAGVTEGVIVIVALELLFWGFDFGAFTLAMQSEGVASAAAPALVIYCLGQFAGAVPLLPGGAGTVDATLLISFRAFGFRGASVVAGVLLYRIISTWAFVPIGWVAVLFGQRRRGATPRSARFESPI
jgi:putative heme transporter